MEGLLLGFPQQETPADPLRRSKRANADTNKPAQAETEPRPRDLASTQEPATP